ncbi:hypothetical protein D3C85_1768970 [compost metagenome]
MFLDGFLIQNRRVITVRAHKAYRQRRNESKLGLINGMCKDGRDYLGNYIQNQKTTLLNL